MRGAALRSRSRADLARGGGGRLVLCSLLRRSHPFFHIASLVSRTYGGSGEKGDVLCLIAFISVLLGTILLV